MRQKKALSYVDLAVSAGVFILYLVIAIAVFKPGIKSDFRPDILTSIIQQNIQNEIYWQAQRIPIFVNQGDFPSASGTDQQRDMVLEFPFDKLQVNNTNSVVLDVNLQELPFDIATKVSNNLSVEYWFRQANINKKSLVYLTYFPGAYFSNRLDPDKPPLSAGIGFTYKYGVKETLKGISPDKFISFNLSDYPQTKRKWGYPDARDFSIEIFQGANLTNSNLPIYVYQKAYPASKEVPVYVIEYVDLILYQNTTRQVITVRIKAW